MRTHPDIGLLVTSPLQNVIRDLKIAVYVKRLASGSSFVIKAKSTVNCSCDTTYQKDEKCCTMTRCMTAEKLSMMGNSTSNRSTFKLTFKPLSACVAAHNCELQTSNAASQTSSCVDRTSMNINLKASLVKQGVCERHFQSLQ